MRLSSSSLAKLLTTRAPASESSSCEFTALILRRLSRNDSSIWPFAQTPYASSTTVIAASTSERRQLMNAMMTNEPTISMEQITSHSGPWWAHSAMSKRSLVTRLMRSPVLWLSKYEKLNRS